MSDFGMFFLHELDLKLEGVIPCIWQKDTNFVTFEAKLKVYPTQNRYSALKEADPNREHRPSREMIKETLKLAPWAVIQEWEYPSIELFEFEDVVNYPIVEEALRLFKLFTMCIWDLLDSDQWQSPTPDGFNTVENVLKFWQLADRMDDLIQVELVTVTGGLGRESFDGKFSIFFPAIDAKCNGGWRPMWDTYIKEWWRVLRMKSEEEQKELEERILKLFQYCQCLPNGLKKGSWIPGKDGEVVLVVNPGEYHEEILENRGTETRLKRKCKKQRVTKTNVEFRKSIIGLIGPLLPVNKQ
ncbi:hypothetical protein GYMLUDRAFT_62591 [Collybiopsis luxurians FD-317 M1]|uniref:Uncharacterized protein n=1 Tax=Collybiopsis luxurians FD-317 M1 TaxID=944289 RepID=A0A0D0BKL9_9AGAR|nr:hypothetical protein GYMLUDRAFT_62591 [Collybiopsis luxurians FD-317 M1]